MLNIVVNARDAMNGEGVLTISARSAEIAAGNDPDLPAGRYVCMTINDTGSGMDTDTLARAREPFFTTKGGGKGPALASRRCMASSSNSMVSL